MGSRLRFALAACMALLLAAGCHAQPQVSLEPTKKAARKASAKSAAKGEKKVDLRQAEAARQALLESQKFTVPFAWEAAKDEPLALTRAFLREALTDNQAYMEHGERFFAAFAEKQTPRATIVTCADSRVHSQAWDSTPENDDFTIRNIGNQIENGEGSVEYGVEHLGTPLLLVVGHTGCAAVKAAMGDISQLGEPIRKELEHLHVPTPSPGKTPDVAWAEAVIANVNGQVAFSLKLFSHQVHEGKLTIVGAVYDFRNDLAQGAGRLVIVNVNGNSDAERMASFVEAVNGRDRDAKDPPQKRGKAGAPDGSASVGAELAKVRGLTAHPAVARVAIREAAPAVAEH